jgi:hypothetical protein
MTDWIESVGAPAALGTGTDEATLFSNYRVPSKARQIKKVMPIIHTTAPAAGESILAVLSIGGNDFDTPYEILCPVGGSHLGTIGANNTEPPRWHEMNYKVNGNEKLDILGEALDAMAGNARIGMNIWYADYDPTLPTVKALCTREIAVATSGRTVATAISLQNVKKIFQIEAAITGGVVTADEPLSANIALKSSNFNPINTIDFDLIGETVEATSGIQTCYGVKFPVELAITDTTIEIVPTVSTRLTLTAAGQAGICFKYTRTPKQ